MPLYHAEGILRSQRRGLLTTCFPRLISAPNLQVASVFDELKTSYDQASGQNSLFPMLYVLCHKVWFAGELAVSMVSKVCSDDHLQVINLKLSTPDRGQRNNTSDTCCGSENDNGEAGSSKCVPHNFQEAHQQTADNELPSPSTSAPYMHKRLPSASPAGTSTPAQLPKRFRHLAFETDVIDLADSDSDDSMGGDAGRFADHTKATALEAELQTVR